MSIDRRSALGALAALTAAPGAAQAADAARTVRFEHGVASGDPQADRVILWTRITPSQRGLVNVSWEIAEAAAPAKPVASGKVSTGAQRDYTVKVDAGGLKPGRDYVYRFKVGRAVSPSGRARTLPAGALPKAVLVFVTCSLFPNGYFNVYDHIARLDEVDAIVHLGDYIYEYGAADSDYGMDNGRRLGRIPDPPHEMVTLADYRRRHALYKRDADLQAAHARAPWICVWDDHEIANDSWIGGAENHQAAEGPWPARKAAALQAYYEWMPIREPQAGRAFEAINRSFQWGDLASLVMLESRVTARTSQLEYGRAGDVPMTVYDSADPAVRKKVADPAVVAAVLAAAARGEAPAAPLSIGPDPEALQALLAQPERQMLGRGQEQWLAAELAASVKAGKPWQVLGNQVVMARTRGPDVRAAIGPERLAQVLDSFPAEKRPSMAAMANLFTFDVPYDLDGWDGYPAARERVYDAVKAAGGNTIVLSGDSHAFWANALHDAAGQYVAAEFGVSSVTSPGMDDAVPGLAFGKLFVTRNREVRFCDQAAKGYIRLTLTPEAATADMMTVQIDAKPYRASLLVGFRVTPAPGVGPGPIELTTVTLR